MTSPFFQQDLLIALRVAFPNPTFSMDSFDHGLEPNLRDVVQDLAGKGVGVGLVSFRFADAGAGDRVREELNDLKTILERSMGHGEHQAPIRQALNKLTTALLPFMEIT